MSFWETCSLIISIGLAMGLAALVVTVITKALYVLLPMIWAL